MIDGVTRLVGLLGWPVAHSLSPAMHNAAFDALHMNWRYVPLPVHPEAVTAAVRGLGALGFAGANVTVPHKTTVLQTLDSLSTTAAAIGAVNTLVMDASANGIRGHNTDASGFMSSLQSAKVPVEGERAVVVGAGGAARAVVFGLVEAGASRITVLSRAIEQAAHLSTLIPVDRGKRIVCRTLSAETLIEAARTASLLINATPVGMAPHIDATIWPEDASIPSRLTIYDLVYAPQETRLLQQARAHGARGLSGLEMLIHQGAAAFELWTGKRPPIAAMRAACKAAMNGGTP